MGSPLTLINHPTSIKFLISRESNNLYFHIPKKWSQFATGFPFLSYSNSPPPTLCSRFSLPSFLPLSFHSLRPFFTSMATSQAATDSSQPSQSKTVRVVIKGRVQGVFYRNWTIENATQLGLKGWVRNRRDGSVEALFSGYPESVQEMEKRCRRGPQAAMVTGLEVFPSSDDPGNGFVRKQTV
ncbi:Acylphosphatase [Hibiscus syriacus]|uniref:acylphosphatase n=1 Tax=Hibiscus syriacus TaxID=106335 RepID=A0A6A3APU1_HIBSY|nr:uncharacterized protein LOC120124098 [Hibiscus syriacus]KAE8705978.1 Acylphosphatase [Hibiscus syriacus]